VAGSKDTVRAYAAARGLETVREFYDAAVSAADAIDARQGFLEMLAYTRGGNGTRTILVENASRFARDLTVWLVGHDMLKRDGTTLVAVDAPDHFLNEIPTAVMVRQILGAVAQFQKAALVEKLRQARLRVNGQRGTIYERPDTQSRVRGFLPPSRHDRCRQVTAGRRGQVLRRPLQCGRP
jgi:DNA invertase Pin-like site-specific DNA recombinase